MTEAVAKQAIAKGDPIPLHLIWNGAEMLLKWITSLIENRSTLRARVSQLEGICVTQGRQIEVLEGRIKSLEK